MRRLLRAASALGLILVVHASVWAQGCAMCITALESSPEGKVLASSFAHGILLMLFLPYTLFGLFAFLVYRAYRKKSKDQRDQQQQG